MSGPEAHAHSARRNQFRERLTSGTFVVTAEVVPPVTCDPEALFAKVRPLKGLADAVNVTDGAGARVHMGSVAAAALLLGAGVEPILQLTCRDRNRIALQSDLLAAAALGIENLLLLRGDSPSAGDQPDAKAVFDLDAVTLSGVARDIRDSHKTMSGQQVSGKAKFFIGAADAPIDPPAGWKPDRLKAKVDAGAQFAQTQFCMDPAVARRYAQRLAENGLEDVRLVIGLVPLRSARSARWIRDNLPGSIIPDAIVARMEGAGDPVREGRRICDELVEQLSETSGIGGVHIMAPGNDAGLAEAVASAAQIAQRQARKHTGAQAGDEASQGSLLHL
ncbi:MAG TPA: methylenetetrahydrofolate reductase [Hyphomicrobiaceae bacterium]|jgi:methylenetetrahydrofolate reductase (NADPH)